MNTTSIPADGAPTWRDNLLAAVRRHWGFDSLRPLQEQAMRAVLEGRDSLLVLPTGGGKSLCYQAPAVVRDQVTVVISPLISLMKDQVDGLRSNGVPAVQLNSAQSMEDLRQAEQGVLNGKVRLIFASPERMATGGFRGFLKRIDVRTFAIDEAHCISHWGHDFRPEYRQLKELKELFPLASVHAFTATATEPVRADIVEQLGLRNPEVLVGNFDRPNLTYRVVPRHDEYGQTLEVLGRHQGEAGIIYCLRRRDVDSLSSTLKARGINAIPYHAGMTPEDRKRAHDLFTEEKCDVVVATVAFGMGIDRSNIRYVLHTGMPKSIEHYQQETGRAGRDGLEAECVLLYSAGDAITWKKLMQKSVAEAPGPVDPDFLQSSYRHVADMEAYCRPVLCRHRSLVEYFGQTYPADNCGACDLCLGDAEPVPDAQTIAKKILSCVFRVQESFGIAHVISVLRGANTAAIRQRGHDKLTTHGLLAACSQPELRNYIQQLIGQGALVLAGDEFPILKLNAASWDVMNDRRTAKLVSIPVAAASDTDSGADSSGERRARKSKGEAQSWEGVDRQLFEALRALRLDLAAQGKVPPYLVFGDATLRELARVRPSTLERMRMVYGIGDAKLRDYGAAVLELLNDQCHERDLSRDNAAGPVPAPSESPAAPRKLSAGAHQAAQLFRQGMSIEQAMQSLGRARSTTCEYLSDYIRQERPASIATWVPDAVYQQVAQVVGQIGPYPMKPIFAALEEKVPYDIIRLVISHLQCREQKPE
ncbi:MAG: DNA helicase RecQ [Planctomycetales bacterium]